MTERSATRPASHPTVSLGVVAWSQAPAKAPITDRSSTAATVGHIGQFLLTSLNATVGRVSERGHVAE